MSEAVLEPAFPSLGGTPRHCLNCHSTLEVPVELDFRCQDCGHVLCEKCCDVAKGVPPKRSKMFQFPPSIPVPAVTLGELFRRAALTKALKAFKRHGEKSYQFVKAMRSRWLNG